MLIRLFWDLFKAIFFRGRYTFPEFVIRPRRLLLEASLILSSVFLGRPGVGKTVTMAVEQLEQMKAHPEQPFFIFDWSGGLITILFLLILSDPRRDELLPRLVFDSMGGRKINGQEYVMPLPEFAKEYDPETQWLERVEDQVDRVERTFEELNPDLVTRNPSRGGRPVKNLLPNLLQLANAVTDAKGNSWQITEATKLLDNSIRHNALKRFGGKVGKALQYFSDFFKGTSNFDKDMGNALADVLDVLKSRRVRARVGYTHPGWTPCEAEKKGLVVCCDGSGLTNNRKQKDYLFLQLFHLVLDFINKRQPSVSGYEPINWIMDEVYTFIETSGVSSMLAHLTSEYRSRKLQFFLAIQSLKQLAGAENGKKGLEDAFFSFGNMVIFSLIDIDDCFAVVKNLIPFDPNMVKVPAQSEGQHAIMENRDEQLAVMAYQLQHLPQRECYVRRFIDESRMDRVLHIGRTRDAHITATYEEVEKLKDKLMLERGVLLSEAEAVMSERKISVPKKETEPPNT